MTNTMLPKRLLCAAIISTLSSAMALADQPEITTPRLFLEEMLVTAQKRDESRTDVPISVSAFSGQYLEDIGATDFEVLADYIPGVEIQEQSAVNSSFAIRGITSDNASPTAHPRVSVFQNGVDISDVRGANPALYDLASVEVLKGPQGTLFGRGAEIGAVHLIQRQAQADTSAQLEVTAGSDQLRSYQGHINGELTSTFAARLAFYQRQRDGFVGQDDGRHLGGDDTKAFRLSSVWRPAEKSEITLTINRQRDRAEPTPFTSFYFQEALSYDSTNLSQQPLTVNRDIDDVTLRIEQDLNEYWSLTAITGWREYETQEWFDADGFELPVLAYDAAQEHEQLSQELRFNFNSGSWQGFVGVNYYEEQDSERLEGFFHEGYVVLLPKVQAFLLNPQGAFDPAQLAVDPPVFAPFAPLADFSGIPLNPQMQERQFTRTDNQMWDVFADATYELADDWRITAGLRYSREQLWSELFTPEMPSPAGLSLSPATCADGLFMQPRCENGEVIRRLQQSKTTSGVSGRLVVEHDLTSDWLVYGSYARGRRPDVLGFTPASNVNNLRDEQVDSLEFGLKRRWTNGATWESAVYYHDYQHFATEVNGDTPILSVNDNGSATARGIESAVQLPVGDAWSVFANVAYNDARIDDKPNFENAGNRFRLSPLWSGALGVSWNQSLGNSLDSKATLTYRAQSEVFFEDDNNSNLGRNRQESYGLLNAQWVVSQANGPWQLRVGLHNALDEQYITDAGNTGGLFGLSTYVPGTARQWQVGVRFRYD